MARTLLSVTSGQTQSWSFGLQYDDAQLLYYLGSMAATAVTTAGTQTATVQNGAPPDLDDTEIQAAYKGYAQGVMIDTNQAISLGPTANFVTSKACFRITMPLYSGTYAAYLKFTHAVGNPNVRTVITQTGLSNVPCVKNFTFTISVSPYAYSTPGGCSIAGGSSASSGPSGGSLAGALGEEPEGGAQPAGAGAGGPLCPRFRRGDSNDSGVMDLSDAVFTLNFLFLGGAVPHCMDSADTNDDGRRDISDPVYTLAFLFIGGLPIPNPAGFCGDDPTPDALDCLDFNSCNDCGCRPPLFTELLPPKFQSELMASKDVQIADLDGDGDLDCFVPESRGGPCQPDHVYINRLNEPGVNRLDVRGDLTNAPAGDYDGMGNWDLLMSQNTACYPWMMEVCNQSQYPLCAAFETTYASAVVDVGSPQGGGPDGMPDVITVDGGDFMRVLINLGTNPPAFEDQSGKLVFDAMLADCRGGWKPDPLDSTSRIYNSIVAPLGSGLPADKNPIDLLGPLVTDRAKFVVNDNFFVYEEPGLPKDTRSSLDDIDVGDIDLDGDVDIIVANRDENRFTFLRGFNLVLRNRGTNTGVFDTFELAIPGHSMLWTTHDAALGDYDLDGDLDLVLANELVLDESGQIVSVAPAELFRNNAKQLQLAGTDPATLPDPASLFERVTNSGIEASTHNFHVAFVDLNQDGQPDIHVASGSSGIYWNNSDGTFSHTPDHTQFAYNAAYGDLNMDGWTEIVTVNYSFVRVFLSNCDQGGQVTFSQAIGILPPPDPVTGFWDTALGVAIGDLDGDGDNDIVVSQGDFGALLANHVYLNQLVPNP
jgi:hypothetical protein